MIVGFTIGGIIRQHLKRKSSLKEFWIFQNYLKICYSCKERHPIASFVANQNYRLVIFGLMMLSIYHQN